MKEEPTAQVMAAEGEGSGGARESDGWVWEVWRKEDGEERREDE